MKRLLIGYLLLLLLGRSVVFGEDPAPADRASPQESAPREVNERQTPLNFHGPSRDGDQVWLIDTRNLAELVEDAARLVASLYGENGKWKETRLEALFDPVAPNVTTVFFLHGYGSSPDDAEHVGWAMYHALADKMETEEHLRYVIWSWPSAETRLRLATDMREKARRTNTEAVYLAWLLARIPDDSRVTLIGYSFGARIVTGALHLSAEDPPKLRPAERQTASRPAVRAVLITPALHSHWLEPGKYHAGALARVDHMLVTYNVGDPALTDYGRLWNSSHPAALGTKGIASLEKLGALAERVTQIDVAPSIGNHHGIGHYLRAEKVMERVRALAVWRGEKLD